MTPKPKERHSRHDGRADRPFVPERYEHVLAASGIIIALLIFFFSVLFGGKIFLGPDTIASHSFDTYLQEAKAEGVFPLWNPYIFCGYSGYGSLTVTGDRWFDFSREILNTAAHAFGSVVGNVAVSNIVFYYILLGLGTYVLLWDKLRNPLAAFIGSFATLFSQFIILWIMIGHNTKIMTVWMFPLLFLVVERLEKKASLRWSLLLVLLLHYMVGATHVQMAYYGGMAFAVYFMYRAILAARSRVSWSSVLRPAAILGIAATLALMMDADRYLSVLEYNPYSIRGSAPLVQAQEANGSTTGDGGLDYDYATNWSLAPGELMTFVIPTWYGFGHLTYEGPLTAQPFRFNAYWGPQPFTDGAQYMGVLVLVLAIIGFVRNRKETFVQYLLVMIVFSLLIAFGKEMPILYDPLFSYLPMFNKFRIPSMILVLVQMFVPMLAAYGVHSLMQTRASSLSPGELQRWKRAIIACVAAVPAVFILRASIEDFYRSLFPLQEVGGVFLRQFGRVQDAVIREIYEYVVDVVIADIVIGLIVVATGLLVLHLYRVGRISVNVLTVTLVLSVGVDLWRISYRPMDPQPRQDQSLIFSRPDYVAAVENDSTDFRTLMFRDGQPPFDNTLAYWRIENAFGYQGAKMRAYQDVVDIAGLNNPLVWQLMNVKYIFSNTKDSSAVLRPVFDGQAFDVYEFAQALPRAFFVDTVVQMSALQTVQEMARRSFDPRKVAYVIDAPPISIDPPREGARVEITHRGIQNLEASIVATGNNAIFFSETWYPEGWKAYLDGNEIPILRFNYLFRGVLVPEGEHTLRMDFEPAGFVIGKNLSLALNTVLLGGFAGVGLWFYRKQSKTDHVQPPADNA